MTDLLEIPVSYYKVTLDNDDLPEDPASWGGWKVASFCTRHNSFIDPYTLILRQDNNGDPVGITAGLRRKLAFGTAFWLSYYEHGDGRWSIYNGKTPGNQWDGVRIAGLLTFESKASNLPKSQEDRRKQADSFLDTYNNWSNGNVFMFHIDRLTPPDDNEDFCLDTDSDKCVVEDLVSSNGFYGDDDLFMGVRESLKESGFKKGDQITVDGDHKWIEDYHELDPTV